MSYSNRIDEMRSQLNSLNISSDESYMKKYRDAIDRYADLRRSVFDDLVNMIDYVSLSNEEAASRWPDRARKARDDVRSLFSDAERDGTQPSSLKDWFSSAMRAENDFFEELAQVSTPSLYHNIFVKGNVLKDMAVEFTERWTIILDKSRVVHTDETRALDAVDEIAQQTLKDFYTIKDILQEKVSDKIKQIEDKHDTIKKLSNLADPVKEGVDFIQFLLNKEIIPPIATALVFDFISPRLAPYNEIFNIRQHAYKEQVENYRAAMSGMRDAALSLFNKTRADVNEYFKEYGLEHMKVWLDQAKGSLDSWAGSAKTYGLQRDGREFAEAVSRKMEDGFRSIEDIDNAFRRQFLGVFINPLGRETIETMAGNYLMKQHLEKINNREVPRILADAQRQLEEAANRVAEMSAQELDESLRSLPEEVRNLAKLQDEDFKKYVREKLKDQMTTLMPSITEMIHTFGPDHLEEDFSTKEVEEELR